jgi:Flp pilus assembly protein TadG
MSLCRFLLRSTGTVATRIRENRQAGIALIVAISLPFLIGAAGFATDAAFWFAQHAALQSAADAGALAAARALETTPGTAQTVLATDALAAANGASNNQFSLTAASLTVSLGSSDTRQVEVDATTPAKLFFSPEAHIGGFNIHTRAVAGVTYSLVSTQAVCQALDSFTYIYSTGFGTLETAHSSGIDPYTCGQSALVPPLPDNSYCNGGVTACTLTPITNALGLNIRLLPLAFQVEPNGYAGGGLLQPLSSAAVTISTLLTSLLSSTQGVPTGAPTIFQQGSTNCPSNVCTITAGIYPGGIVIGPGVTFNFATNGGGLGNNYFVMLNGNLVISTQAVLGSGDNNFTFFMLGAAPSGSTPTPGGYVAETQVQVNLAPIAQGNITYTSTSNFNYNSVIGMQISSPVSSMYSAQQAGASYTPSLLGSLGLPGGNLIGSNFEAMVAVCPQATTLCATAANSAGPQYQTTLMPSASGVVNTLTSTLGANTPLASVANDLLSSSGETSSTTFTTAVAIGNGTPTYWEQTEAQTATLNNVVPALSSVITNLNGLLNSLLGFLFQSAVIADVDNLYTYITGGQQSTSLTVNAKSQFPGQTASGASAAGCATGATNLYAGTASINPGFGPVFTNLINSSGGTNEQTLGLTTTDTILICGTNSHSTTIAQIMPGQTGMTGSTAAGASTLALLQ